MCATNSGATARSLDNRGYLSRRISFLLILQLGVSVVIVDGLARLPFITEYLLLCLYCIRSHHLMGCTGELMLQLVSLAAVVFVTLLVTIGAERKQAPAMPPDHGRQQQEMQKLLKECTNYCVPFKIQCLEKLCASKKNEDKDKYWWCIGGCVEYSGLCIKVCVEGSSKNEN